LNFIKRAFKKYSWVTKTAGSLGADTVSKVKILTGGFWLLLTDSGKSKLSFKARITSFGNTAELVFEDIGDFGLLEEVFLSEHYPFDYEEHPKLIVDLGANIGISTLYFCLKYPNAEIHSFEPDPLNLKRLKLMTEAYPNVKVHDIAVWSHKDDLVFYSDPHRGSSSSAVKIRERQKEITVRAESLETILNMFNDRLVDILKIDVEGAEENVFSDFKLFDKIRNLVGEIHSDLCDGEMVIDLIKSHYKYVHLEPFNEGKRFYIAAGNDDNLSIS